MKTIFESCEPRPEVLKGELREDIFAARLKDVIDGRADPVYQDPDVFFDNTYPTEGLKLLLAEVLGRLTGVRAANNAIVRLETAFGGGKTHNLIALYHTANGHAPDPALVDPALVPASGVVRTAGVVGSDLQPRDGLDHGDATTYTLWGEIAYQLAGAAGGGTNGRTRPGRPAIMRKLKNKAKDWRISSCPFQVLGYFSSVNFHTFTTSPTVTISDKGAGQAYCKKAYVG